MIWSAAYVAALDRSNSDFPRETTKAATDAALQNTSLLVPYVILQSS
jgi:hypothetical protein